jgi:hypothetical protein
MTVSREKSKMCLFLLSIKSFPSPLKLSADLGLVLSREPEHFTLTTRDELLKVRIGIY